MRAGTHRQQRTFRGAGSGVRGAGMEGGVCAEKRGKTIEEQNSY